MNDLVRKAMQSEYGNVMDLMGVDDQMMGDLNELMGGLGLVERVKLMQKLGGKNNASKGSRADFEKFFREVPADIQKKLLDGDLRLADFTIYSMKQVKSKTVKLFETQDVKESGITNISNARLPKNYVFTVSGIYLLAGVCEDPADKEKVKATDFKSVGLIPAIANAEFSLKSNKTQFIPEGSSVRKFVTDNDHFTNLGYLRLDNPRMIKDDELIEFVVELGTMQGIDAKTFIYVGLDGTVTTP